MNERHGPTRLWVLAIGLLALPSVAFWTAGCSRRAAVVDPARDLMEIARRAADEPIFDTAAALSPDRLRAHASFLADGALAGRFPGTAGIDAAEEYIRRRLVKVGAVSPPATDDHAHGVALFASDFDPGRTGVTVSADGRVIAVGSAPLAMRPLPVTDLGSVEAQLVFAGYGITAPEHDWDDYREIDVDGRIVLVLRYEPGAFDADAGFPSAELTDHSLFATKAAAARNRGAVGMIVVTAPTHGDEPEDLRTPMTLGLDPRAIAARWARSRVTGFSAAQISRRTASEMIAAVGLDLETVQSIADSGLSPAAVDLSGLIARIDVEPAEARPVAARNIVGFLSATGSPSPPGGARWIVIGAHHDHLGSFGDTADAIYHGADDNASGVAGVLELAAATSLAERPVNVAFATFTAEEEGLLGSRAFVRDAVIPPERIALMVNLDMIGRNPDKPVRVYTSPAADGFADAVARAAEVRGLEVSLRRGVVEEVSDHYPFHQAGVPVVSVFTGLHDDYHRVTDTADRLDYDRMSRILTVLADALTEYAQQLRQSTGQ
ncbi:MAG: M28 family peptidase [Spirochaetaceae bacterium]|nr:MAG: M28 family peptidase [Spirochaetaceae bacterium]